MGAAAQSAAKQMNLPDPNRTPSKLDKLSMGPDCAVHPLVGNIVAQNGVPPGVQTRDFLAALRHATVQKISGRDGDMSESEFDEWMHRLDAWEAAGNKVQFPTRASMADHRLR